MNQQELEVIKAQRKIIEVLEKELEDMSKRCNTNLEVMESLRLKLDSVEKAYIRDRARFLDEIEVLTKKINEKTT